MLKQIVTLLYQKGYRPLDENEKGVYVRLAEDKAYLITLSVFDKNITPKMYEQIRRRAEFIAATRYRCRTEILHLVAMENDDLNEDVRSLVENTEHMWLISAESRRIYVFENQSDQFDDLYLYLDQGLKTEQPKAKRKLPYAVTPVNMTIVVLNILVFLVIMIANKGYSVFYDAERMLKWGAMSNESVCAGAWYQVITSLFVHFGAAHLINNMILLIYAGSELEKRIGSLQYAILYLVAGIGGNLASLWYYSRIDEEVVSAGASGAIFGVVGALFVVLLFHPTKTQYLTPHRLVILVFFTIYYGMTTMGIDNAAHIGGIISGIIVGFLLSKISQCGTLEEARSMR